MTTDTVTLPNGTEMPRVKASSLIQQVSNRLQEMDASGAGTTTDDDGNVIERSKLERVLTNLKTAMDNTPPPVSNSEPFVAPTLEFAKAKQEGQAIIANLLDDCCEESKAAMEPGAPLVAPELRFERNEQ